MSSEEGSSSDKKKERKTLIKEIVEIAIFLGIAVLLVFSFNWILSAALHTDSPLVIVTSESMQPTYMGHRADNDIQKDMLVVRGVDPSEIVLGDVIVYYVDDPLDITQPDLDATPIVHRVIRIYHNETGGEYWFTTKGDNTDRNNGLVSAAGEDKIHENRLIGKIIGRIPLLGGIINYFKTTPGRIVLAVIVVTIIALTWVMSSFGEDKDKKKEKDIFADVETSEEDVKPKDGDISEEKKIKVFWKRTKAFYKKQKYILIPSFVLAIVVFVPIVDSLAAQWGSAYGVEDVEFFGAQNFSLAGGDTTLITNWVDISCPGHWHQEFKSFGIQISNITTGAVLGSANWTILYNFEGTKTLSSGVMVNQSLVTDGLNYSVTVIAYLSTKFGKTWTDVFTNNFTLVISSDIT